MRTRNFNPTGHTRLPRYARGKIGLVDAVREALSSRTATRMAAARTRNGSTPSSSMRREIWGEGADPTLTVSIDAWESYLEPA